MKPGSRILGIDDSPFEKGSGASVLVVGVLMRGPVVEGVLSTFVDSDGDDATDRISEMILRSRFSTEVRAVMLNSIMMAGFNVVDISELSRRTGVPVIAVMRRKPDMGKVGAALANVCCTEEKMVRIKRAGNAIRIGRVYAQFAGTDAKGAAGMLSQYEGVPEPVRLAHVIAGGIMKGESSGKA